MTVLEIHGKKPRTYKLVQSGIVVITKVNSVLPTEEHIKFENIRNDKLFYRQRNYQYLIVGGFLLVIFAVLLSDFLHGEKHLIPVLTMLSIGILASVIVFFVHQPKVYFLKTYLGKFIKFKVNNNEAEIDQFIKLTIENRNNYIKLKYGTPSLYLPYDNQYSNFNIMLAENMITLEEYKKNIEMLNLLFNQTSPSQIFQGYSQN